MHECQDKSYLVFKLNVFMLYSFPSKSFLSLQYEVLSIYQNKKPKGHIAHRETIGIIKSAQRNHDTKYLNNIV